MINWCAYCQRFLGEIPPYDKFSISHGMCDPCSRLGLDFDTATEVKIKNLASFQKELWRLSAAEDVESTIRLIEGGLTQGMRAADLLLGSLGAILYKASEGVCKQYGPRGQRLDEFCTRVVEASRKKFAFDHSKSGSPDVIFVSLVSNPHTIAVQLLELWMNAEGISSLALVGKTCEEVLAAVEEISPMVVGFSVSSADQIPEVRVLAQKLKAHCDPPPLLLLGGHPIKMRTVANEDAPELSFVPDESKLFLILKSHLALGFLYDLKKKSIRIKE